jgi:hypothetical protein
MFGLVTVRRVQNGFIRQMTRRAAHSGLLESIILRQFPRRTYHFLILRTFPSKDTRLWSLVRARRRF